MGLRGCLVGESEEVLPFRAGSWLTQHLQGRPAPRGMWVQRSEKRGTPPPPFRKGEGGLKVEGGVRGLSAGVPRSKEHANPPRTP